MDDAMADLPEGLSDVLESAARLQARVPDAVLDGGAAAALYARHRMSTDHDHIIEDLQDRYEQILDALELAAPAAGDSAAARIDSAAFLAVFDDVAWRRGSAGANSIGRRGEVGDHDGGPFRSAEVGGQRF